MKKNMGRADRSIRFVIGLAIIIAGIIYGSWWGALGVILVGTAFVGLCPAYLPFRISTRSSRAGNQENT